MIGRYHTNYYCMNYNHVKVKKRIALETRDITFCVSRLSFGCIWMQEWFTVLQGGPHFIPRERVLQFHNFWRRVSYWVSINIYVNSNILIQIYLISKFLRLYFLFMPTPDMCHSTAGQPLHSGWIGLSQCQWDNPEWIDKIMGFMVIK